MLGLKESIDAQLGRFAKLRAEDPEAAQQQHETNERLVALCGEGSLRRVKELVEKDGDKLMTYFVVRAFKAALLGCHLVLADYLIGSGYPLNSTGVPYVLLEVINDLELPGHSKDEVVVSILQFLVSKQWNVNMQASKSWVSALHMCVQHSLLESTRLLVLAGADVDSVASGDVMPLAVAEQALAALTQKKGLGERAQATATAAVPALAWSDELESRLQAATAVRELLVARGARGSWRRSGGAGGDDGLRGYAAGSESNTGAVARPSGLVRFSGGSGGLAAAAGGGGGGGLVRMSGGAGLVRFTGGAPAPAPLLAAETTATPPPPPAPAAVTLASSATAPAPPLVSSAAGAAKSESDDEGEGQGCEKSAPSYRRQDDGSQLFSTGS